jgi:hypothetical protein
MTVFAAASQYSSRLKRQRVVDLAGDVSLGGTDRFALCPAFLDAPLVSFNRDRHIDGPRL